MEINMAKKTQVSEEELARMADDSVVATAVLDEAKIMDGKPFPSDIVNPPAGKYGHYCCDPQGVYHRRWSQLKLHRHDDSMPSRQYFANGSEEWRVLTGEWVDVPPELLASLELTEIEVIEMDVSKSNPILDNSVKKVVNRVPRFSATVMPSA